MSKGDACFYCRHSRNKRADTPGWAFDCALGIDNTGMNGGVEQVVACPKGEPRLGFQIGGYYTHMWFEEDGDCLDWCIASDGESPTEDDSAAIRFHICDFDQIKRFVAFWDKELERRGLKD